MKKATSTVLALLLLFTTALPVQAQAPDIPIRVMLDGEYLEFDVPPQMTNSRVLVPVRFIFEALGAEVSWDYTTNTVTAETVGGDIIALVLDSTTLTINGVEREMDVPAKLVNNRTLAPVRFIAEALGRTVDWDGYNWTVIIAPPLHLEMYNMTFHLADASSIEVHDFQLEDGYVTAWDGAPIPAPLAGLIAIPDTPGPHPLVVIMHGSAMGYVDGDIRARVYSGFDYLVQQLAAEGYVAISINVSIDYSIDYGESAWGSYAYAVFEQHLERLQQAALGEEVGHGIDLTDAIDFDEIHIIGHSRGGELADIFVRRDQAASIYRIHSIIRLAPTVIPYHMEEDAAPHPDIPVGIILPELDGDVWTLDGQLVFDEVMAEARNQSMLSLVLLRGANHQWFNRYISFDDGALLEIDTPRLTREEQEDFLMHYAAAFLARVTNTKDAWGTFDASQPQPATMFGCHVVASTYLPGVIRILEQADAGVPAATATGSATAELYIQSWGAAGFFNHPMVLSRLNPHLALYDLQWTDTDAAVSFTLTERDFSGRSALSLYLAMDSSNPLNPAKQDQGFTLTLRDGSGNEHSLAILPGANALTWHPGHAEYNEWAEEYFWVGHMPLGELRIPLAYFPLGTLDRSDIASLTISFDQTPSGAVMLYGIYLI